MAAQTITDLAHGRARRTEERSKLAGVVAALEVVHLAGATFFDPGGEAAALVLVFGGAGLGHSGDAGGGEAGCAGELGQVDRAQVTGYRAPAVGGGVPERCDLCPEPCFRVPSPRRR